MAVVPEEERLFDESVTTAVEGVKLESFSPSNEPNPALETLHEEDGPTTDPPPSWIAGAGMLVGVGGLVLPEKLEVAVKTKCVEVVVNDPFPAGPLAMT